MRNFKNYLPLIVFAVTLVLSGISVVTSRELASRKTVLPTKSLADGCTNEQVNNGTCPWGDSIDKDNPNGEGGKWVYDYDSGKWYSHAESPDPSAREQDTPPPPPPTNPPTQPPTQPPTNSPTPTSSPVPTSSPTPTSSPVPTNSPTPTKSPTPTNTPTGTLTPTATPTPSATNTPSPTPQPNAFRGMICENRSCQVRDCNPPDRPCSSQCSSDFDCNQHLACVDNACKAVAGSGPDQCQTDVNCQPAAVTPATPVAASVTPTILTVAGGLGLFILGVILIAL